MSAEYQPQVGIWLSEASASTAEIVALAGCDFVLLDAEHGAFGVETLERHVPFLRALGLDVWTKVAGPQREPIQQALDFGSDGVIIPHVTTADHAREVTAYAKFPPLGARSVAGGRMFEYGAWPDDLGRFDRETRCFPLIEDPRAVAGIDEILALDTVDGFFMGPGDLSMTSGRGRYEATPDDWADIERCVTAAAARGLPWMYPAWSRAEQEWAVRQQASMIVVSHQHLLVSSAVTAAVDDLAAMVRGGA